MTARGSCPSSTSEDLPPVMTPAEVAERWRMSIRHVDQMLLAGTLRGFRCGNRWRITAEAVIEHEQGSTT